MNESIEEKLKQLKLPQPDRSYYKSPLPDDSGPALRPWLVPALSAALVLSLATNVWLWTGTEADAPEASFSPQLAQSEPRPKGPEIRTGVALPGGTSDSIELYPGG